MVVGLFNPTSDLNSRSREVEKSPIQDPRSKDQPASAAGNVLRPRSDSATPHAQLVAQHWLLTGPPAWGCGEAPPPLARFHRDGILAKGVLTNNASLGDVADASGNLPATVGSWFHGFGEDW
jgi:hypothetical protein